MLSIVIPTLNEAAHIGRILGRLEPQLEAGDEVLVVDSGSTDGTPDIADGLARVLPAEREGIGKARTDGAAAAANALVAFLDADSLPCEDWVARAKAALRGGASGVCGIGFYDAPYPQKLLYDSFSRAVFHGAQLTYRAEGTPYLIGNNMAISKDVFFAAGGFRSVVCEDYDFGKRLRGKGARFDFDGGMWVLYSARKFEEHGFLGTLAEWGRGMRAIDKDGGQDASSYSAWRG